MSGDRLLTLCNRHALFSQLMMIGPPCIGLVATDGIGKYVTDTDSTLKNPKIINNHVFSRHSSFVGDAHAHQWYIISLLSLSEFSRGMLVHTLLVAQIYVIMLLLLR